MARLSNKLAHQGMDGSAPLSEERGPETAHSPCVGSGKRAPARRGLVPSLISQPCSRINQSFGRSAQDQRGLCLGSGMTTMVVIVFSIALALLLAYYIK